MILILLTRTAPNPLAQVFATLAVPKVLALSEQYPLAQIIVVPA